MIVCVMVAIILSPKTIWAQEKATEATPAFPGFQLLRENEDFTYLKALENQEFWNRFKYISLSNTRDSYLTIGGEIRSRFEYFRNPDWGAAGISNEYFYSQRLALHSSLQATKFLRFYGEIYHGLLTQKEPEIAQDNNVNLFQGFVDLKLLFDDSSLTLRVGRQEIFHGAGRLVAIREGPNIRRSFDAARLMFSFRQFAAEVFLGNEVFPDPEDGLFENKSNKDADFYGAHVSYKNTGPKNPGKIDVYYYSFDSRVSVFNEGSDSEKRHTYGLRRSGRLGNSFEFNTEFTLQTGSFGPRDINAWALEIDNHYLFQHEKLKKVGLKLDYISGDRNAGDDMLQTFNPLFNNPAYFGLLGMVAPVNLMDIHPSVMWELDNSLEFIIDWDFFWRASKNDGLYSPPRFLNRGGQVAEARFIGHQAGYELKYEINRHLTWNTEGSLFFAGKYLEETGEHKNVFHVATTISFKF